MKPERIKEIEAHFLGEPDPESLCLHCGCHISNKRDEPTPCCDSCCQKVMPEMVRELSRLRIDLENCNQFREDQRSKLREATDKRDEYRSACDQAASANERLAKIHRLRVE